jgi:hypothetical protein
MVKDILKILIGFLVANAIFNFYFAVSGDFPPPFFPGGPQLTFELSQIAFIADLVIVAFFSYLVFLRKGLGRVNLKDASKVLIGASAHGVLHGLPDGDCLIIGGCLALILIFIYLGFFRK